MHSIEEIDSSVRLAIPKPRRVMAPFQWYGGKGKLAKWIIRYLPEGNVYVEPFAGAASVFWHLPKPYPVEVLNDIHREVVNMFRVLKDPETFEVFAHRATWTPYSLDEFRRALKVGAECKDPVTRAWAFFVRQNQGFSGRAITDGDWGRSFTPRRGMSSKTNDWRSHIKMLEYWHNRLASVQIDNRDAITVIKYWDNENTVFYMDPPYVASTRKKKNVYAHEFEDEQHSRLVEALLNIQGKALLSGYDTQIYYPLEEAGWKKVCKETSADAAGRIRSSNLMGSGSAMKHVKRFECLWISPGVIDGSLF